MLHVFSLYLTGTTEFLVGSNTEKKSAINSWFTLPHLTMTGDHYKCDLPGILFPIFTQSIWSCLLWFPIIIFSHQVSINSNKPSHRSHKSTRSATIGPCIFLKSSTDKSKAPQRSGISKATTTQRPRTKLRFHLVPRFGAPRLPCRKCRP